MIRVDASIFVLAPIDQVMELYADYSGWPAFFPTISHVRLVERRGRKLVLDIEHVDGPVVNELVFMSGDVIDLIEFKRRYSARFRNRFISRSDGTLYLVTGDIFLKGPARILQPFLRGYVRRQMLKYQLRPVKGEAESRVGRGDGRHG